MRYTDELKSERRISRPRRAFTLAEMVVSVAVMIILLGITGMIYKSASDAMDLNNASVTVVEDNTAFTRQVDLMLKNINTDGYLVIYGYDVCNSGEVVEKTADGKIRFGSDTLPSVRSDAICFFTSGAFNSQTDGTVAANTGWAYIGHAGTVTPTSYGASPFDAHDTNEPLVANRWVLSRYLILFEPVTTVAGTFPNYDYRNTFTYNGSTYNCTFASYMRMINTEFIPHINDPQYIRNWFYAYWINDYANNPYFGAPPVINFNDNITFPYTISNCGSFKVEFVMPRSYFNKIQTPPAISYEYPNDEPEKYGDGTLIWRSALNLAPDNPNGNKTVPYRAYALDENFAATDPYAVEHETNAGNVGGTGARSGNKMVVFGPKDVWPLMIKFTLRKYDESLKITNEDTFIDTSNRKTVTTHGGQTLEYIYHLPAKQ